MSSANVSTAAKPAHMGAMYQGIGAWLRPHRPTSMENAAHAAQEKARIRFDEMTGDCMWVPGVPHLTTTPSTFWQIWARCSALFGAQPGLGGEGFEDISHSKSVDSVSHELVATAAAPSIGKNRKVQAGDSELVFIPWHYIKDPAKWRALFLSPPRVAALPPAETTRP